MVLVTGWGLNDSQVQHDSDSTRLLGIVSKAWLKSQCFKGGFLFWVLLVELEVVVKWVAIRSFRMTRNNKKCRATFFSQTSEADYFPVLGQASIRGVWIFANLSSFFRVTQAFGTTGRGRLAFFRIVLQEIIVGRRGRANPAED